MTKKQIKELRSELLDWNIDVTDDELDDLVNSSEKKDFYIVLDGNEYRFIDDKYIWDIYVEEIQGVTEECYLGGMDTNKLWRPDRDWETI